MVPTPLQRASGASPGHRLVACAAFAFGALVAGCSISGLAGGPDAAGDAGARPDARTVSHDAGHDAGPPAFVQSSENNDVTGGLDTQLSAPAFDHPVAAGDMLLVAVQYGPMNGVGTGTSVKLTVEDTQGNAFHELDDSYDSDMGDGLRTFYAADAKGGADDAVVVQVVAPPCHYVMIYASEYTGVHEVVAHDMILQASAPTTPDGVTVALTSSNAGTLVWAFSATTSETESLFEAGEGFTARGPKGGSWPFGMSMGKPQVVARAEDRLAATGSQLEEATWTVSVSDDTNNAIVLLR